MKLKATFLDKIKGDSGKYDDVIKLRNQVEILCDAWENVDIWTKLPYIKSSDRMIRLTMYSFDEVKMYEDKGLEKVIKRLQSDKKYILNFFGSTDIPELTFITNEYNSKIRKEKLKRILK